MFTENCRESFRTPYWGRKMFRWFYEKTRLPICPIYGGFPVKMITHLAPAIHFPQSTTADEIRKRMKREVRDLIREHQRLPGSILRSVWQRIYDDRRKRCSTSSPVVPPSTTLLQLRQMNDASTTTGDTPVDDGRMISDTTSRHGGGDGANGGAAVDILHQMSPNRQAVRPLLDHDDE